jgi:hypothetical protein
MVVRVPPASDMSHASQREQGTHRLRQISTATGLDTCARVDRFCSPSLHIDAFTCASRSSSGLPLPAGLIAPRVPSPMQYYRNKKAGDGHWLKSAQIKQSCLLVQSLKQDSGG